MSSLHLDKNRTRGVWGGESKYNSQGWDASEPDISSKLSCIYCAFLDHEVLYSIFYAIFCSC